MSAADADALRVPHDLRDSLGGFHHFKAGGCTNCSGTGYRGRFAIRVEGGSTPLLQPADTLVLEGRTAFVWPGVAGGDGFRLEVEVPGFGSVELTRGAQRQVVHLAALETRVRADESILPGARVDFTVDASWVESQRRLIVRNAGAPLTFPGGRAVGESLPIDPLPEIVCDGVRVVVRMEGRG